MTHENCVVDSLQIDITHLRADLATCFFESILNLVVNLYWNLSHFSSIFARLLRALSSWSPDSHFMSLSEYACFICFVIIHRPI